CVRKYWSKPLRNHLMKEFGLRILIRKVQLIGMQYEKALIPIFSYSKDHYFRVFFEVNKGKKRCDEVAAKHKLMVYDDRDMSIREFELNELTKNSIISNESFDKNSSTNSVSVVGPIWNGELFNLRFVEKIRDEIIERYKRDNELVNFVNLIYDEAHGIDDVKKMSEAVSRNDKEYEKDSKRNKNCFGFDSCNFYDVSIVCKRIKEVMPKPNDIIRFLGEKGKIGFRTHFNYKAIKGNFNYNNLVDAIKVLNHNKKA
ncbi:MAG: hypothetical protein GWP09_02625, partial [Nitrospiraceae bacterium]|nr:hypothetical protein [Nitrospiraceae bacterium]